MRTEPSTHCDGCGRKLFHPVPAGQVAYCSGCWAQDDRDQRADDEYLRGHHGPGAGAVWLSDFDSQGDT